MSQESLIYATNLVIGAILAVLLTYHWRLAGRESSLGHWMVAAWVMTGADVLFALRPELTYWVGRFFPTVLVTVGQTVLLLWATRAGGRPLRAHHGVLIVMVHAVALAIFLAIGGGSSSWRTVSNGLVWGTLSVASYVYLRRAPEALRREMAIPAFVFLGHGAFHGLRTAFAFAAAVQSEGAGAPGWLQTIGDVEVSFFMVALFVSLLVAHLQLRNQELRAALSDVQLLSGLLPICAWCRKVRSDDGYWEQLETYFESRRKVQFTHGICGDCQAEHFGGGQPAPNFVPPADRGA